SHDSPLFDSIISDLFPRVVLPTPDHGILDVSIREIMQKMNLQAFLWYIKKIMQSYKIMLVQRGFKLIGSPLGGKTSALKVLAGVLEQLEAKGLMDEHRVEYVFIRPKAITMARLYGTFDPVSHEWSDGVLVNMCQKHATSLTKGRKWCIFDVPVAAIWIQIMNTCPNDNKQLCLMSGEIIQMSLQENIIF
ncbi:dynein heavy chain 7, axonemal-like, partial [Gopherus evgoodei]|uniref:dynein heavy chain 7, axonemal-like n=1 Tax=Gopherus evgoodei TaxID=1825980 RepID=UPI0011D02E92